MIPVLCRNCDEAFCMLSDCQNADWVVFARYRRLLPAPHGEGVKGLSSKFASLQSATCPGLFVPSIAQDGLLYRLRVPGGLLSVTQCEAIVALQIRRAVLLRLRIALMSKFVGSKLAWSIETLEHLQVVGLASPIAAVDSLRNIMGSPTAGSIASNCSTPARLSLPGITISPPVPILRCCRRSLACVLMVAKRFQSVIVLTISV